MVGIFATTRRQKLTHGPPDAVLDEAGGLTSDIGGWIYDLMGQ